MRAEVSMGILSIQKETRITDVLDGAIVYELLSVEASVRGAITTSTHPNDDTVGTSVDRVAIV